MTVVATDAFTRANGGLGANWTTQTAYSAPQIVSNAVPAVSGVDQAAVYTALDAGQDDMYASVTSVVSTSNVHNDTLVWCRMPNTGAETGYMGDAPTYDNTGRLWTLQVATAGAFTLLAQSASGAALSAGSRTLLIQAVGTTITLKQDGVTLGSVTDSTHSGATKRYGGFHIYADTGSFASVDDFEMGTIVSAAAAATPQPIVRSQAVHRASRW